MDDSDFRGRLNTFYSKYRDPTSTLFLEKDIDRLYSEAKRDADLNPVSRAEILRFKSSLSTLSRDREKRILRGRKRVLSYRRWIVFGPNNILLGDLAFLPSLRHRNGKRYIILVLLDAFSRLCFLSLLKNATSGEVARQLDEAFRFFGGPPLKFASDRGEHSIGRSTNPSVHLSIHRLIKPGRFDTL